MKKFHSKFLCALLVCSVITPNISLGMNGGNGNNNNPPVKKTWGNRIVKWLLYGLLTETLAFTFRTLYYCLNKEKNELKKIESLILISKELEKNIKYVKKNSRDRALLKQLKRQYLELCIKIAKLQQAYTKKYVKTPQMPTNK